MNRRDFLHATAVLAAGASVLPSNWVLSAEQKAFLASQPSYIDSAPPTFFTTTQRANVSAVVNHIIPATDTPGAIEAGTPRFVELMVADWFDDAERKLFVSGLDALEKLGSGPFAELPADEQLALLDKLEEEASDSGWYSLGNVMRVWDSEAPFICQIKELTVLGFCLSEVGATQFLRENPMGTFVGDLALAPDDVAYAPAMPIRMMAGDNT